MEKTEGFLFLALHPGSEWIEVKRLKERTSASSLVSPAHFSLFTDANGSEMSPFF